MGGRRPSEGSPSPACVAQRSARVHLRREGRLLCAPAVRADPPEPCSSIVPPARCCRGLAGASCPPCVTAHAFGSWRAVSEGSPGQGWQSSFMISRLFKRPHKKAPSILKGKWLFAGRQGGDKAGIRSADPSRDSAAIRLLLFFQRFIDFIQEGPVAQHVWLK